MEGLQRYLAPRPAGVAFAVRSPADDPRRRLVLALLAGAADAPMQLAELAASAGIDDHRELGTLLFQMQRDDWVQGELKPFGLLRLPLGEALPVLLARLSSEGAAVLATGTGLRIARVGVENERSDFLAALAADVPPSLHRPADGGDATRAGSVLGWRLPSIPGGREFHAVPLHVGATPFHLVLSGVPQLGNRAFIDLIGLLSRRYGRRIGVTHIGATHIGATPIGAARLMRGDSC